MKQAFKCILIIETKNDSDWPISIDYASSVLIKNDISFFQDMHGEHKFYIEIKDK